MALNPLCDKIRRLAKRCVKLLCLHRSEHRVAELSLVGLGKISLLSFVPRANQQIRGIFVDQDVDVRAGRVGAVDGIVR